MANVVINTDTIIGKSCIINTAATIDHDCVCKDFIHISPGVHIAGTVHIGNKTWIGIGSSAINNITICDEVTVGGGATIIADIKESGKYVGTPVKRVR